MQYGQFIEYLCDLVPSMWAERLYDGSFEGLSPYKFAFHKETDFREKPWRTDGSANLVQNTLDRTTKISGDVSRKLTVTGENPTAVGLSQDGIFVDRGAVCTFSCFMKQEGLASPVRVRLHQGATVYAEAEIKPAREWAKYRVRLSPSARDVNATLSIELNGPGTLWLDNASLMPEENVKGWRKDVVEAVRALKPGIIRFGGSALDDPSLGQFNWRDTVGDPDRRRPFRAWGGLQPTGPGLEEIVQFCHLVGAEPLICARINRQEPRDAADEVAYFNGSIETPMGAARAQNGHPEPYQIRYWQIGNEQAGADYERRLVEFARAMKAVDPTIRLMSSYPTPGVLRSAGSLIEFVSPHHYDCANLAATRANFAATRRMIQEFAPGRPIQVAVTEWNTTAGDWGPGRAKLWRLENALACSRYHNLLHRQADLAPIANRSNLINSFCSGIVQTDNHRLYKAPTYYAQQLYATLAGNRPLTVESSLPTDMAPDVSATLSADGHTVVLFAVNDTSSAITRPLDLSAFGPSGQDAAVWTLADRDHGPQPNATNTFSDPERVAPVRSSPRFGSSRFDYTFPEYSLTVLRWAAP